MNRAQDREQAVLIDVSSAVNSALACRMLEDTLDQPGFHARAVDLNVGPLLLSRNVLVKIQQQLQKRNITLGTVYAQLPQTQQAALDEGLFVKQHPVPATSTRAGDALQDWDAFVESLKSNPAFSVELPQAPVPEPVSEPTVEVPVQHELVEPTTWVTETQPLSSLDRTFTAPDAMSEKPQADTPQAATPVPMDLPGTTLFLRQTLRSGQTVRFDGNIVIVGDVHAGSEVSATGDILIWGELRGIAHAGKDGNYRAEIRAMKIEALQIRIAEYIARRPDRIYYHKDQAVQLLAPEVAKVADGEIRIFKEMIGR